ncbi:hypothetical protein EDC04DRAFT_2604303 [Pisolithus marmoratus]|nr:hypothetical protein EDC04DRAFT_2604303 [Pisolithus marmoratus]
MDNHSSGRVGVQLAMLEQRNEEPGPQLSSYGILINKFLVCPQLVSASGVEDGLTVDDPRLVSVRTSNRNGNNTLWIVLRDKWNQCHMSLSKCQVDAQAHTTLVLQAWEYKLPQVLQTQDISFGDWQTLPVYYRMLTGYEMLPVSSDGNALVHNVHTEGIWEIDISPSCIRISTVTNGLHILFFTSAYSALIACQSTLCILFPSHLIRMDEFPVQGTDAPAHQGKIPCPLQLIPNFHFPPISGAHPNSPYLLDGNSATTSMSSTPNINDSSWGFLSHPPTTNPPTLPNQDSLVPEDVTAMPKQQTIVAVTQCEGGVRTGEEMSIGLPMDGLPEAPPRIPVNSPHAADHGHEDAVPLHEETMNAGDTSTQDTPHSDTCASHPPTGAGDPPQSLHNASWEAHCILLEKVKLLITGESHYWSQCEESLVNALVCIKACQVNADCPPGQKFQLKELQEMVTNDLDMQNLYEETKQNTNTVASHDVYATLKKIYKELQALTYHTGIYACLFITHGHVYDTHDATCPDYIIKQLELWACNEEKNIDACNSLENMQKQAKNGLNSSFSTITKHLQQEKPICLQFANFEQIKYKFGIDYEGWPDRIPFSSPYKIQTIDEICHLQDVIRENSFQWVKMTPSQHHEYCKQVDMRCEAGEMVRKKHKAVCEDNPQPSKKSCRGRATQMSCEIIKTSDEDSDGTGIHI